MGMRDTIAAEVRAAIERGEYAPGSRLPSEPELGRQYGVSAGTARAAMALLVAEGLVLSSQGKGRIVRQYAPLEWPWAQFERQDDHRTGWDGVDAWEQQTRDQGRAPHVDVVVEIAEPPAHIGSSLALADDAIAVVRRRVRYVDGMPYLLQDSWFAEDLVRDTPLMRPGDVSAPGGVLASIGHVQVRYVDRITVRMPHTAETERLTLPPGTPVAEHIRTGYSEAGKPLRCMVSILPGDRHTLVYEVEA